jgi:hypothetical protein
MNPNVNYGLWEITSQCRFITDNKCATLVQDVDKKESSAQKKRSGSLWELSSSSQFDHQSKSSKK